MFKYNEITLSSCRWIAVLIFLSFFLFCAGCAQTNTRILGEWQSTATDEPAHSITFDRQGEAVLRDSEGHALTVFQYDINGEQLTLTTNGVETTWTFFIEADSLNIDAGGAQSQYNKIM